MSALRGHRNGLRRGLDELTFQHSHIAEHQLSNARAHSFLLVVDPQRAFGEVLPVPGVDRALENMRLVAAMWRASGDPFLFVRHAYKERGEVGLLEQFMPGIFDVLRDDSPLSQFHSDLVLPTDPVLRKTRFSALVGTDVLQRIEGTGMRSVTVMGLTTPICVQTTVDDLMMAGMRVTLVEDGCASQALGAMTGERAHAAAINRMRELFAEIVTARSLLETRGASPAISLAG